MKKLRQRNIGILLAFLYLACGTYLNAQAGSWTERATDDYSISANVPYGTFGGTTVHLDIWQNKSTGKQTPTLVYIHGGGWVFGDKTGAANLFLPYLERGWSVVNVEYRMADKSLAPAAVEDVRCALRFVTDNADRYNLDLDKLVVSGHSAGGHLALMAGMLPNGTDFDSACPASETSKPIRVAAIVNWYGITDIPDLLAGPHRETYAIMWMGAQPERLQLARQLSPLSYVRSGLPPVITIHGDRDPTVDYSQGARLAAALTSAGVPNELFTVAGGSHGSFGAEKDVEAFTHIWKFLDSHIAGLPREPIEVPSK